MFVKDVAQEIVKKDLCNKKASTYKRNTLLSAPSISATEGNLNSIKSDGTLRIIKMEAHGQWDRDKDHLFDLIKMQRDHEEYVQEISLPFCVKTFSEEHIQMLSKTKINGNLPLIYAAVICTNKTNRILPVFQMISAKKYF